MLGIESFGVLLAFLLCVVSAVLCVGYGLWRWNLDEDSDQPSDVKWAQTHVKEEEALP